MTTELMTKPEEVETVKNEIQVYIEKLPMTVSNQTESELAKTRIMEVRAEKERRAQWFDESFLNDAKEKLEQAKKTVKKQEGIKADLLQSLSDWIDQTDQNILDWDDKEARRIAEAQAKENAKWEAAQAKAEEKGKDPESVKPPKLYQAPPKTVKTAVGSYTVKTVKVLVVFDEKKIPDHFFKKVRNDKMIEAALRSGQSVPGARLDDKRQSSMRL